MSLWANLNPFNWFGGYSGLEDPVYMPNFSPAEEIKTSAAGPIYTQHLVGRPVWTERDFAHLAKESYQLNTVAFRCVKMIAGCSAQINLLLKDRNGNLIEKHPLLDLLARPAPMISRQTLLEAVYSFLMLSGNSYIEAVGPDGKPPRELWTPRPDRMRVVPDLSGIPAAFEYEMAGRRKRWDVDLLTGASEILHLKEFHPLNDWYGMSRFEAAGYGLDRHNAASAHNKALLDNGARPSGAMIFEPITSAGGDVQSAPEAVIKAAEKALRANHAGTKNAGKPMVLSGKVKWEAMGLSPTDMDFAAGKDDAARDICIAAGVPHILIVAGAATFNNVREAKLELYEDTVLPLVEMVLTHLNIWLAPRFGDGLTLAADLDSISALEPRRETKRKATHELLTAGVIDQDEAREALQYGPRKPEAIKKVEPSVITALLAAVQTVGLTPLARYMKSVGLFDPSMTEEQILQAAMDLTEADPVDPEDQTDMTTEDPNEPPDPNEPDPTTDPLKDTGNA